MLTPKPDRNGTKDPALTLTQRLEFLDSKLEAKHAEVEAEADRTSGAMRGLKACASDSRTRMNVRAYSEEDLEEEGLDAEAQPSEDQVSTQ